MTTENVHPVDAVLPPGQMFLVGLQHVLVMYAGAIVVPLIVGGALKMPTEQLALLINADLFACGIATLIQGVGFWKFGIRLPVVMGVTFAAVGPLVAMANAGHNVQVMYGAVIAAGVMTILVAPVFSKLLRFFPPVVTGTIITVIGITLLRVGITWAGGGAGAKNFGALGNLSIALVVLVAILTVNKYLRGFWANISVLLGLIAGFLLAVPLAKVNITGVGDAPWFGFVMPFWFGLPEFEIGAVVSLCIVMFVVMVESTGMFLALGEVTHRPLSSDDLTRGLRADGLGTVIGGIFNTFPYTSYSQNVGLVGVTGVHSRWVVAVSGVILIGLGLLPKLATLVASIPQSVLGGAGIAMFGMVAATGIKILSRVDFENRSNLLVVAISIGVGMIPLVSPTFFDQFPSWSQSLTHSGITLTSMVAIALNAFSQRGGQTVARASGPG
ncbi:MAG: nucleobase:cation symporter-2 family protein [Betaproteobacteria bacterium]